MEWHSHYLPACSWEQPEFDWAEIDDLETRSAESRATTLPNHVLAVAGAITIGEADDASERVAVHTSLRQSTTETGAAFVRRITLAMLSEMVEP